jgi:hypothetical protein
MDWIYRGLAASAVWAGLALSPTSAQERMARPQATSSADLSRTLTGKERLGRKWSDEQRLDNCNVPIDKRGTKPRPDACESTPSN